MSTRIILIDDLDGSTPATETVTFEYDGTRYEIDLAAENAERLREVMAPFIAAGRRRGVDKIIRRGTRAKGRTAAVVAAVPEAAEAPRVKRKYAPRKKVAAAK